MSGYFKNSLTAELSKNCDIADNISHSNLNVSLFYLEKVCRNKK